MKYGLTTLLKLCIAAIALGVITALVSFPLNEGRATNLDLISIYTDPFIMYIYISFIPFFIALYKGMRLLSLVEKNALFSLDAVAGVNTIKYCAVTIATMISAAIAYIALFQRFEEDITGGVVIGLILTFTAVVVATAAAVFQKLLQQAIDIQSENESLV